EKDSKNMVLGEPQNYYRAIEYEDILKLREKEIKQNPKTFEDWLIPFAKFVDLSSLKFPIFIVNEFGLNMFKIAAGAQIALEKKDNVRLKLNSEVIDVKRVEDKFLVTYELSDGAILQEKFDYLINAAGFLSGKIDDMLGFKRERYIEFKAAYVTKWQEEVKFPEIIFHGKRGTKDGMAQFTPYFGGYYQLHGMSKEITLFENGLVKSTSNSTYPKLDNSFLEMIERGWDKELAELRTKRAVEHFKRFIPSFTKEAKVTSTPLYGAQQIPGNNPDLRAAEVSFEGKNYARCEIVKVSSAINMAKEIAKEFNLKSSFKELNLLDSEVTSLSKKIAASRGYPQKLGVVLNSNLV
ncbi:MAG: FAD-dependent oxidoreductase, partial [Epsilonproteobacteria bacterium]|nr:FAD-dependent oxidoreductase [Campylobacterota bacterium]